MTHSTLCPVFPRILASISLALLGANASHAQTGPFRDGELIAFAPGTIPGHKALYRIDPASGDGEMWIDDFYPGNLPGWFAYEPVRDRVLAYIGYFPVSWNPGRLWSIAADGTPRDLGFEGEKLSSFAPTGDGRVFMNKNKKLHMLTEDNQLLPVLTSSGTPYDLYLDHWAYDAASNSLIGVAGLQPSSACHTTWAVVVHRLPLNAAGTQLSGPEDCSAHDLNNFAIGYPMGLDLLPNGNFLVALSNIKNSSQEMFLEIDRVTLDMSVWSLSTIEQIDGGVYTPILGKVVALRDVVGAPPDVMHVFAKGQGGAGVVLNTDIPIDEGSSGNSTTERFGDITFSGPACEGYVQSFGAGLSGTGGVVPKLHIGGCPRIGAAFDIEVWSAVGGSGGLVLLSTGTTALPIIGGTLYVLPPFNIKFPFATSGTPGSAGSGAASLPQLAPNNPVFIGLPLYLQAVVADPGAVQGFSLSNAILLTLGQ